jgi:hypothetical protein
LNLGDKEVPRVEILTGEIPMPTCRSSTARRIASSRPAGKPGDVAHEAMMMALPVVATNWGGHTDS